ncbi:MAG: protein-L-isoaspartate O-methyltransferase family protein [Chloroflexota bacterium]
MPINVQPYLEAYVTRLKQSGALSDPAIESAFYRVPRHLFVERFFVGDESQGWIPVEHDPEDPKPEHLETIYSGTALVTRLQVNLGTSSSSQPALMANMLQLLELRPGMCVLEIGAGTGYNAGLLAELVGNPALVTTLDIQPDVVEHARRALARAGYGAVHVWCRDGFEGATEAAPFDRIVATVGCPDLSPRWAEQLAPSGFMLIPLRHAGTNPLVIVRPEDRTGGGGSLIGEVVGSSGFMAVQGALADPAYYASGRSAPNPSDEARILWPDLGDRRMDFLFYLGVRDGRTRLFQWPSHFGLVAETAGRSARVEQDRLAGNPALLDELDALYDDWRAIGSPATCAFQLRFTPADAGFDDGPARRSAAGPWTLPGPFYHRQFALRPGR